MNFLNVGITTAAHVIYKKHIYYFGEECLRKIPAITGHKTKISKTKSKQNKNRNQKESRSHHHAQIRNKRNVLVIN